MWHIYWGMDKEQVVAVMAAILLASSRASNIFNVPHVMVECVEAAAELYERTYVAMTPDKRLERLKRLGAA